MRLLDQLRVAIRDGMGLPSDSMLPASMPKRRAALIAIVLVVAMCALGLHAAAHWHGQTYNDQVCQACHAGHTVMPQPVVQLAGQTAAAVQRFAAPEAPLLSLAPVCTHRIPRAPPA
jgi:hypothetical protein